ncbi:MAG: permease [Vicinamibacterales bacterium]
MNGWHLFGSAASTAVGLFWKAGWAFVLGYAVSAMIQAFVPKGRLTRYLGAADLRSLSLATIFGAASSSCSFAALATARALVQKGAHFIAAVAFMFASTNLVIELGILILIFLGWQFLAAEIAGGLLLIVTSSFLIRLTYPARWFREARDRVEASGGGGEEDFDWRRRVRSREGWRLVGRRFVDDWLMVWEEILIGFTVAGFVAVLVPSSAWEAIFLIGARGDLPEWLIVVQNAVVAPLVASATFIGSMGNIPLATVLNTNGVLFAGIMGFIYSDLMVPPLVMINAKYYGARVALYIAGVMFASIVVTALAMHYAFAALGITPGTERRVEDVVRFAIDYTFFLNLAFAAVAAGLVWLSGRHRGAAGAGMDGRGGTGPKRVAALACAGILAAGLAAALVTRS